MNNENKGIHATGYRRACGLRWSLYASPMSQRI